MMCKDAKKGKSDDLFLFLMKMEILRT